MASNYTNEQVKHMIEAYSANPTRDTVDELAISLDKSVKIYHWKAFTRRRVSKSRL